MMQEDWAKWRLVLSPVAVKLWRFLDEQDGRVIKIGDLCRDLHVGKEAVRRGMAELADHNFIGIRNDDDS